VVSGVSVKMGSLQQVDYFPHIEILLHAMRINRERLNGRSKIAVDAKLLRRLVELAVSQLPFSSEFYERTYHDIAEARAAGKIADLHKHFIETGFFEGRLGAEPSMDEAYYRGAYRDVALAVQRGDVASGLEHYLRSGAAEGRIPCARLKAEVDSWMSILHAASPTDQ
jgi:hypothetical protein